ncbi:MAG TPA: hypothetical protein VJ895_01665 [Candidatus Nanoarchaeia archaeon]|nr:hypothetical protein [Candidatus Nanoarchaeia archaeon]
MAKKKSVKKKSKKTQKITSNKVLEKKKLKTAKLLTTSTIIFLVSLVLYFATNPETMKAIFGFMAILAGATILLGITIEVILFLLKRAKKK